MNTGHNRGATRLKRSRRAGCPMQGYDRLPPPLRGWMATAALPWSARSCLALWQRALKEGASHREALDRLDRAEAALLARDAAL